MRYWVSLLVFVLTLAPVASYADDGGADDEVTEEAQRELVRAAPQRSSHLNAGSAKVSEEDELVNLDAETVKARLHSLERRVAALERENTFRDEKIRSLDRSVDDIRRREIR